ncbi:MAG: hypothetical protein PXX73_04645 [Sideroxydans sp.]|nr:hypothetical protein [Sideroxydans sp.]
MITIAQLQAMGCSATNARRFAAPLDAAMLRYDITTLPRIRAFLAQVAHESGRLQFVREIWNLAQCPWQAKYEGRIDLGNTRAGDGKLYMGRGLIQITGRANYAACSRALGRDFVLHPELLELPVNAALSAAWFWQSHGCNELADAQKFITLTRVINGGTNGLSDRLALLEQATTSIV